MRKSFFYFTALLIIVVALGSKARAQQYKLRQVNNMMNMKSESTVYVKGMRKRTENAGMMGMGSTIVIEQCDLQRNIKINDKKKLYYIEPFAKETEEVIDEDALKNKPATAASSQPKEKANPQGGGVINMWYTITDTAERKKMYNFTARHIWTSQKIKPSPDACTMKDSIIMKTDGWYIDFPQFNCPVQYRPARTPTPNQKPEPECKDRFVTRRSGKGKLGFPLTETRTIIMGNSGIQKNEFQTSIETLELTTEKLDSMLFEIPLGYQQATNESELQDKFDMKEMLKQAENANKHNEQQPVVTNDQKRAGVLRIGVYAPTGDEQVQASALQQQMVTSLTGGNIEAVAIASAEDAQKFNCDYTLSSEFSKIKQASKIGGLLKAIKNTDPGAAASFNIEASQTLVRLSDGSTRLQPKMSGKYEGKIDDAAKKALDEGCSQVVKALK